MYELHRLLTAPFGMKIESDKRMQIIEEEYNIPMKEEVGKDTGDN